MRMGVMHVLERRVRLAGRACPNQVEGAQRDGIEGEGVAFDEPIAWVTRRGLQSTPVT